MKKIISILLTASMIACSAEMPFTAVVAETITTASQASEAENTEKISYKIVKNPDKTVYKISESIDLKGIQVERKKGNEEPVIYAYPDVAFDYQSNIPKPATVVISGEYKRDKVGTVAIKVVGSDDVLFNVEFVDDSTEKTHENSVMLTTESGDDGCYVHLDLMSGTFSMSGSVYQNFAVFGKFERKGSDLYLYAENGSTNVYVLHREDDHFISQSDERGIRLTKGLVFSAENDAFWEKLTSTNGTSYSGGECEDGVMIVPETEDGKIVTEIYLWSDDNIKALKIPATVNKVDIIKCLNLEKIEVSEDNPYLCSVDGVIYSKDMKTLVFYPSSKSETAFIVPDTVEVIREGAFNYAQKLKSVKLSDGVKIIKDSAFFGTKITDFELPETLTDIEQYAFSGNNSLTSITLPASLKHAESPFLECEALTEIVILHEMGDEHFESSGPRNPDDDYYSALLRNGSNITVFVPDNSYEDYNKYYKDRWKCKNILPLSVYGKIEMQKKGSKSA